METETPAHSAPWIIPGMLIALLLVLLLNACTPSPSRPPSPTPTSASRIARPAPPTTPPATPTVPPTPLPTPTATPSNTLLLWTSEEGEALDTVHQMTHEFGDRQDIAITVVAKQPAAMRVDVQASDLAGVRRPDVLWGTHNDLAELLHDNRLQPVTLNGGEHTDFHPAAITSATFDNQLWGYPLTLQNGLLLLYNRAYVTHPPTTTDDLIVQARAFAERRTAEATATETTDTDPDTETPYGLVSAQTEAWWAMAWLNGVGGAVTTPDGTRPTLNSAEMTTTLYLLRELQPATPPDPPPYEGLHPAFRAGGAVLAIDGDWAIPTYRAVSDTLDMGVAPMPRVAATGRTAASPYGGSYLMLYDAIPARQHAYAEALATFLTTPTTQLRLAQTLHRLPARSDILTDTALLDDDMLAAMAAQTDAAIGLPPTPALRCAMQALNAYLPLWLEPAPETAPDTPTREPLTPAEVLDMMQKSAEQCMIEPAD